MSNSYFPPNEEEDPQYQRTSHEYNMAPIVPPQQAAKGQLMIALQQSIREAQALSLYYDNVAKQLTLLVSHVEHAK